MSLSTVTLTQETPDCDHIRSEGWNALHYVRLDGEPVLGDGVSHIRCLPSVVDESDHPIAPWVSMSALSEDAGNILGRTPLPALDVDLCCKWLLECSTSHRFCANSKRTSMPTRVIDLGIDITAGNVWLVESNGLCDR